MKKPEIVAFISERTGLTRQVAGRVLTAFVKAVHSSLSSNGASVRIAKLGTFRIVNIGERRGVNPRTGKNMTIPAMSLPRFTPARALKETVHKAG